MTKRLLVALTLLAALCCLPSASVGQTGMRFAAPKSGVWRITGKDVEGLKWLGTMRLAARARHGVRATYSGYIDWRSSDRRNSGREFLMRRFTRAMAVSRSSVIESRGQRAISPPGDTPDISADAVAA